MYLLDTSTCIQLLRGPSSGLLARLRARSPSEIALCAVVKAELLFGARRSQRVAENLALVQRFAAPFVCHPFDDAAAEHYGAIRAELAATGRPVGPNDLLIAAIARSRDLTLVSHDGEFRRVVGLRVEDWEAG